MKVTVKNKEISKLESPLANEIQTAFSKLIFVVQSVPYACRSEKIMEGTGGLVSISDIIAYQIGWGKCLISWYNAGIKSKIPDMPGDGFTTWDYQGLALHFYKKYAYDSREKQENEFKLVIESLLKIVENEYKKHNLDRLGVWQWCTLKSGKQWPLSKWIKVNTSAPYKRAASSISKHLLR